MDENRAVELLNKALGCMQTDPKDCASKKCSMCKHNATKEDGIEAIRTAIKALEEVHTLNGNTLTIKISEDDIDRVKRVMLDCAPWCRTFYEDAKDINVPSKSALDHIHNVVAENAFNKGYDAGYEEGYERGKRDAATSLAKRITTKYDEVLGVDDALEEIDNLLEEVAKGE